MSKLLMSIKPEYVEKILKGLKRFEFRKTRCKRSVDGILIYATAPIMKVVAEVEVVGVIEGSLNSVWDKTKNSAGISRQYFEEYYANRQEAVAYILGKVECYDPPHDLVEYGVKVAPQSYIYIHDD